jgi:hypothetical protein
LQGFPIVGALEPLFLAQQRDVPDLRLLRASTRLLVCRACGSQLLEDLARLRH